MLRDIIEATKLAPAYCAELIRVSPDQFNDWLTQKKPVPGFALAELSSILGVSESNINSNNHLGEEPPAIWFKLRDSKLNDEDREFVGFVRKLGYYLSQLQQIQGRKTSYESVFDQVRKSIDPTSHPAIQGRTAAKAFREASGLSQGQSGIGEVVRSHLRALGILLVESPLPHSDIDGCCFRVGLETSTTPCIFSNTFKSSWFRRNIVIAHELCHAIFDLDNEQVALDYKPDSEYPFLDLDTSIDISEHRAQIFAEECLIPKTVLVTITNQVGINWDQLTVDNVCLLIAKSHTEKSVILRAALRGGLITKDQHELYLGFDCSQGIKNLTDRALSTKEYLAKIGEDSPNWKAENRKAKIGNRVLRLPVGYVNLVLNTLGERAISESKAAEMLMVDKDTFRERFQRLPVKGQ